MQQIKINWWRKINEMEWKIVPLTTGKMLMFLLDKNSKQYFEKVHFILKDQYLKCKMVSKMKTYILFSDSSILQQKQWTKKNLCEMDRFYIFMKNTHSLISWLFTLDFGLNFFLQVTTFILYWLLPKVPDSIREMSTV